MLALGLSSEDGGMWTHCEHSEEEEPTDGLQ